jgi:hypothetical protein
VSAAQKSSAGTSEGSGIATPARTRASTAAASQRPRKSARTASLWSARKATKPSDASAPGEPPARGGGGGGGASGLPLLLLPGGDALQELLADGGRVLAGRALHAASPPELPARSAVEKMAISIAEAAGNNATQFHTCAFPTRRPALPKASDSDVNLLTLCTAVQV